MDMKKLASEIKTAADDLEKLGKFAEADVMDKVYREVLAQNTGVEDAVRARMGSQPEQTGTGEASSGVAEVLSMISQIYATSLKAKAILIDLIQRKQVPGNITLQSLGDVSSIMDGIEKAAVRAEKQLRGEVKQKEEMPTPDAGMEAGQLSGLGQ